MSPNPLNPDIQILHLPRRAGPVLRFLKVSYGIYRDDPHWVAPLLFDARKTFSDRNPFLEHATVELWIARQNGRDVGRIAGIVDRHYHARHRPDTAFFGFFESVNDPCVAGALFEAVFAWARAQGLRRVLGPMNPSTNDECGILVEGFDHDPMLMMPYNPPYYPALVAAAGFRKAKDLLAYHIDLAHSPIERLDRLVNRFRQRNPSLHLHRVRRRTLSADLSRIKKVYNDAWADNWDFVPMTDAEIDFLADRLKALLTEGLVLIAEDAGEPVGFLLAALDYNRVFKPLRGRLLSPGLWRCLPYLLKRRTLTACRVMVLGVIEQYRARGIESFVLFEGLKTGQRLGLREAEASWILEDNRPAQQVIEHQGGRVYKTYRIYERDLEP